MPILSKRQMQVFKLLSHGMSYSEIAEKLCISLPNLHIVCLNIRKKTGIKSTKDTSECRAYRAQIENITGSTTQITRAQRRALLMVAEGVPYAEICTGLGIAITTLWNHTSDGYKRLGITGESRYERIIQLRAALGINANTLPPTMDDPFFN